MRPYRYPPYGFTLREIQVADLMASSLTKAQIARRLCIVPQTVDDHIKRILTKTRTHSRLGAVLVIIHGPHVTKGDRYGCPL